MTSGIFLPEVGSLHPKATMLLMGKLHPMLVHLPIALVLAAAAAELRAIGTRRPAWRAVALANLRAGAVMGAVTMTAGWLLASAPFIEPALSLTWAQVDRGCGRLGHSARR
jgi:uncharacterized membrane protein